MDLLKKYWPRAFKTKDVGSLIVNILIYLIAGAVITFVVKLVGGLLGIIPLLGGIIAAVLGLLSYIIDLYCLVGIVLTILKLCKVVK